MRSFATKPDEELADAVAPAVLGPEAAQAGDGTLRGGQRCIHLWIYAVMVAIPRLVDL